MPLDRKLSPLEFTVLGILFKRGPCTAYAVMSEFVGSSSSFYRSGAGSIYPLLRRLAKAGILVVTDSPAGDKHYQLGELGLQELRGWFDFSTASDDFSCSLDLLRSRTYFLKVLSPSERDDFFDRAIRGLKVLLARCMADRDGYERRGDPFSTMAMEGTVKETKARIQWLKECRRECRSLP